MSKTINLKTRDEIPAKDKWKIEKIYETTEAWEDDFQKLKEKSPKLKDFQVFTQCLQMQI